MRMESTNNLRQIILASHNYASTHKDRLPSIDGKAGRANKGLSLFEALLPYINQGNVYRQKRLAEPYNPPPIVPMFISPADPTFNPADQFGVSSYAANAQVFHGDPNLIRTFPDGASTTIAFAEHYSTCQKSVYFYDVTSIGFPAGLIRRATFADGGPLIDPSFSDVHPVTSGNPPQSVGSWPDHTFQVAPPVNRCNAAIAQTPHPSGMLAAMGDGSVRNLAPGMAPTVYWGMVSPAGGEAASND
jgi:hypothetical protein